MKTSAELQTAAEEYSTDEKLQIAFIAGATSSVALSAVRPYPRHGDVVFLESDVVISEEMMKQMRIACDKVTERSGIAIVQLPKGIRVSNAHAPHRAEDSIDITTLSDRDRRFLGEHPFGCPCVECPLVSRNAAVIRRRY